MLNSKVRDLKICWNPNSWLFVNYLNDIFGIWLLKFKFMYSNLIIQTHHNRRKTKYCIIRNQINNVKTKINNKYTQIKNTKIYIAEQYVHFSRQQGSIYCFGCMVLFSYKLVGPIGCGFHQLWEGGNNLETGYIFS